MSEQAGGSQHGRGSEPHEPDARAPRGSGAGVSHESDAQARPAAPHASKPASNEPSPRTGSLPAVSLSARRVPAIWVILGGVVVSTVLAVVTTARIGAGALAVLLFTAGAVRLGRSSKPGPVGLAIRSRPLDVALYWLLAVAIAVLAVTVPGI